MNWSLILEVAGWGVAGIFVILGMFGMSAKGRRQENDEVTQNLIDNLGKKVQVLETDNETLRNSIHNHQKERNEEIKKLSDKLTHFEGRNSMLEDLFKGRDPAMQAVFHEAPQIFAIAKETNAIVKSLADAVEALVKCSTPVQAK